MTAKTNRIGRDGENAVVKYLAANGFPHTERRRLRGTRDEGDLITVPGLCVEVKAGQTARVRAGLSQVAAWMRETELERIQARADIGLLVVQRNAYGAPRAGLWRAFLPLRALQGLLGGPEGLSGPPEAADAPVELRLDHAVTILRAAGYGDPITPTGPTGPSSDR